jgi:hypothetical protein
MDASSLMVAGGFILPGAAASPMLELVPNAREVYEIIREAGCGSEVDVAGLRTLCVTVPT